MGFVRKALTALPLAIASAVVAANVPAISRYLRIRGDTRKNRPMGATTTPRSYVTGRR